MLKMTIFFLLCTLLGPFSKPVHAAETGAGNDEPVETEVETSTVRNPVRQDALTEAQEEEGWKIIGGYANPPEGLAGDAQT